MRRRIGSRAWPGRRERQRRFGFVERGEQLERLFKRGILAATALVLCGLVAGTASGRYLTRYAETRLKWMVAWSFGLPPERSEIDADWQLRRQRDMALTRPIFETVYKEAEPPMRRLLDAMKMDPARAVLCWGNYDLTMILPSSLFQADPKRSYRMLPNTRSVWLKPIVLAKQLKGCFLVPETPGLPKLIEGTGAFIVGGSSQTTNSWGCRGPEPDLKSPLRGLVLGDSNMQGLFIGDDVTPPENLRRELEERLKIRVSILNTGHLGYSPEQYYYSLEEYGDRFRPQFVVLSFCGNDFGFGGELIRGFDGWQEGAYWFERIFHYCRVRNIICLTTLVPGEDQVTAVRNEGKFPGKFTDLCQLSTSRYYNPLEILIDENLRLVNEQERKGGGPSNSQLYNGHIGDGHFSPKGSKAWARGVGHRLTLILERERISKRVAF
ncbi:hypothetical protein ACYOEI_20025 [Singulisphaera rosea]